METPLYTALSKPPGPTNPSNYRRRQILMVLFHEFDTLNTATNQKNQKNPKRVAKSPEGQRYSKSCRNQVSNDYANNNASLCL